MFDEPTFPLAEFVRDADAHAARINRERGAEALTVDGNVTLVVQDAESYQELCDRVERAEFVGSLRSALRDADAGKGRPAEEVFSELNAKYGF